MTKTHPMVGKIKFERTFVMVKPDGVKRSLIGDVIRRFEAAGLKIVAINMLKPTKAQLEKHYPITDEAWVTRLGEKSLSAFETIDADPEEILGTVDKKVIGDAVVESLISFMSSGPVVILVIEGVQAVSMVRKLCGHTLPFKADVGTIRGDYSVDSPAIANAEMRSIHNLIHASETQEEADNEIKLWFKDQDIPSYDLGNEAIMYSKYY